MLEEAVALHVLPAASCKLQVCDCERQSRCSFTYRRVGAFFHGRSSGTYPSLRCCCVACSFAVAFAVSVSAGTTSFGDGDSQQRPLLPLLLLLLLPLSL